MDGAVFVSVLVVLLLYVVVRSVSNEQWSGERPRARQTCDDEELQENEEVNYNVQ